MHTSINAIVYAHTEDDALTTAKQNVFTPLVTGAAPFTTCITLDAADSRTAAPDRQHDLPPVIEADSDTGEQVIENAFQAMVAEWQDALDRITTYLDDHDASTIWERRFADDTFIRQSFRTVGTMIGDPVRLYDHNASGIRDREHLNAVLDKHQSSYDARNTDNPHADKTVYVVPADAYW